MTKQRPKDTNSVRLGKKEQDIGDRHGPEYPGDEIKGSGQFEKCVECVKAVPVFSHDEIDVGDHIIFYGRFYDHHAIVTQKLGSNKIKIIQATNTPARAVGGFLLGGKAYILETVKTLDFANDNINVVVYNHRKYTKKGVSKRARKYFTKQRENRDFNYNIFKNNCEHFATYCVTGQPFSLQVGKFLMGVKLFLSSGFLGLGDEKTRNAQLFENKYICSSCNNLNEHLLNVCVKPIFSADDVKVGDVIRYTYYYLHHEAVVLETKDVIKTSVKVSIAHYAFCGILKYRKIIEEAITIRFDGSFSVLQYQPPQYQVFSPEEVVKRAKSRIGEQLFVFFSNDSSHFARWCKLPRKWN